MPKITRHGGPTIAGAAVVGGAWGNSDDPDVWPAPETEEADEAVESLPEPAGDVAPGYGDWTVEELKEQLGARGLPKSGKRDDLVQRLTEDDARAAEAE
ncbi:SAP domain-containing protein [Streptomyces sp. PmtG]